MGEEGPTTLPWDEKIRRIVAVLPDDIENAEKLAEHILVAIGDANV